jgi:hypothetical protein
MPPVLLQPDRERSLPPGGLLSAGALYALASVGSCIVAAPFAAGFVPVLLLSRPLPAVGHTCIPVA